MGLFTSKTFDTLDDLLVAQLSDLYDAERQLTKAIPKMADAADAQPLKNAFNHHLKETKSHVTRLEQVFQSLGKEIKSETCAAMKGLISEGEEIVQANGDPAVKDAGLIAAAQRVEHYEIAGYGTARTLAMRMGYLSAADLLQQTLDEEFSADRTLTDVAESYVNVQAATAVH